MAREDAQGALGTTWAMGWDTGIGQTHKDISMLPCREMSILEDETQTGMTIGGHPLLTTQRKNRTYVTTEKLMAKWSIIASHNPKGSGCTVVVVLSHLSPYT